tara:strand:- start:4666 stop:5406 length:741 start_codon:yes stop_codon:yes gene_type:complete
MGQVVKGGAISFNEIRNAFGSPDRGTSTRSASNVTMGEFFRMVCTSNGGLAGVNTASSPAQVLDFDDTIILKAGATSYSTTSTKSSVTNTLRGAFTGAAAGVVTANNYSNYLGSFSAKSNSFFGVSYNGVGDLGSGITLVGVGTLINTLGGGSFDILFQGSGASSLQTTDLDKCRIRRMTLTSNAFVTTELTIAGLTDSPSGSFFRTTTGSGAATIVRFSILVSAFGGITDPLSNSSEFAFQLFTS